MSIAVAQRDEEEHWDLLDDSASLSSVTYSKEYGRVQ